MRTALIDGDVLLHQIGAIGQGKDEAGNLFIRPATWVCDKLDELIGLIVEESGSDSCVLFVGASEEMVDRHNKRLKAEPCDICFGVDLHVRGCITCLSSGYYKRYKKFTPNFRFAVATTKPYKGNRKSEKPIHYWNLLAYMMANYKTRFAMGQEADDLLAQVQTLIPLADTIICTRDKDLRMIPGWHYGWECGRQASFGPEWVEGLGYLRYEGKKLRGVGLAFFFAQMIMGDGVDNVPGLPGRGPAAAWDILSPLDTEKQMREAVMGTYRANEGEDWKELLLEQSNLLWMRQKKGVGYDWCL